MFELYSDRIRRENGELDVYTYDVFSTVFRNQFSHLIYEVFGKANLCPRPQRPLISEICIRFSLLKGIKIINNLEYYIDSCDDKDFLDLVDFIAKVFTEINLDEIYSVEQRFCNQIIENINTFLKRSSLGYEIVNGKVIKKTNTVTHETIVKPTLKVLLDEKFRGAEEEYLLAFEHFRKGDHEDAILNAMKAFESCMKIICTELGYSFDPDRDTASKLISILTENQFFPSYLNNHMTGVRTTLESGLPTLRNRDAGHGQGADIRELGEEFVEYALNLAATNIVFLHKLYTKEVTP